MVYICESGRRLRKQPATCNQRNEAANRMNRVAQHTGVVYMLTAPDGQRYIGRTVRFQQRMREHRSGCTPCRKIAAAITKYGWKNFRVSKIAQGMSDAALPACERAFIAIVRPELNLMTSTGGRLRHAESSKQKVSDLHRGKPKSAEHRAKIGAAHRGKKISPEHRAAISAKMLGKKLGPFSDGHRAKLSAANKGKPKSPEHRAKQSAAMRGRPGRPHTPETRAKISAWNRGRKLSPETKTKIRTAHLGKKASPETRAKMSASQLQRAQRKRAQQGAD